MLVQERCLPEDTERTKGREQMHSARPWRDQRHSACSWHSSSTHFQFPVHVLVWVHAHSLSAFVSACVRMSACAHFSVYTRMRGHLCVLVRCEHIYLCSWAHLYMCMCVHISMHVYLCIYTWVRCVSVDSRVCLNMCALSVCVCVCVCVCV